jgi:tetratricopeptide (TPR) repeat protein
MRAWPIGVFALALMTGQSFARESDTNICALVKEYKDQSIAACTRLLARQLSTPNRASAYGNRGNGYYRNGEYDRAIADLNEALRLKPDFPAAFTVRGIAFAGLNEYDKALADLGAAIRLDPKFANPYAHRARVEFHKGNLDAARADADAAIRLNPKYAGGYEARGEIRESSRDYRGALDDFKQVLALKDDFFEPPARAGRERVLAALAASTGDAPNPEAAPPALAALTVAAPKPEAAPIALAASIVEAPKPEAAPIALAGPTIAPQKPTAAVALVAPAIEPGLPPAPGRRVALVVANRAYHDAALANPEVDADLVAATLKKTGFAVTVDRNLGLDAFEQAIDHFADEAKGAEIALFYFAGHGFSIAAGGRQENLLMATDADFQARTGLGLQRGGEPLEHVEEMIIGHARATLIFVDACREVPALATRGVGSRGFAPFDVSAFDGAFVVISTRSGRTASDGVGGQGSPFARAFAAVLPTPRLRIEDAYARIRERVRAETSGEQVPDVIRSDLPEGGVVLTQDAPTEH